ncbi:MAG: hypothetical protein OK441_03275 [Thaumarchaeota archaeon]|nr:hypothetical protein [Nitrososphaerota archaeon]
MTAPRTLYLVIVVLLAGLLISSTFAAFYLYQYNVAENNANAYLGELREATGTQAYAGSTSILLDFGNGTQRWYNDTAVQPGWNVYLATVVITKGDLNDTWYPQYGEHLINGIEGLQNSQTGSWFLWSYNDTSRWQVAQIGADLVPTTNGSVFAWSYCGVSASYSPVCTSP